MSVDDEYEAGFTVRWMPPSSHHKEKTEIRGRGTGLPLVLFLLQLLKLRGSLDMRKI